MSDGYNRVQLSTFLNGDQLVLRTDSGEELEDVTKGVAKHVDGILTSFNAVKKAFIAEGVFTGDSSKKSASRSGDRKPDTPPPSTDGGSGGGDRRTYLDVPFKEKDTAKSHGARWDKDQRQWYVTGNVPEELQQYV